MDGPKDICSKVKDGVWEQIGYKIITKRIALSDLFGSPKLKKVKMVSYVDDLAATFEKK